MRRSHPRIGWLALLLASTACGSGELRFIDSSELDGDYVFFAELDESSRLAEIRGPVQLEATQSSAFLFDSSAENLIAISIDAPSLGPLYRSERAAELRLDRSIGPACERAGLPGTVSADGEFLQSVLHGGTGFETFGVAERNRAATEPALEEQLRSSLALRIPIDADACAREDRKLEAFADRPAPIDRDLEVSGLRVGQAAQNMQDIARLDDRAIVLAGNMVLLFERGAAFQADTAHVLEPPNVRVLEVVAIDPNPSRGPGQGRMRVLVGGRQEDTTAGEGVIWELGLGPEGLSYVATSTRTKAAVTEIVVEAQSGRVLAGHEGGEISTQDARDGPFRSIQLPRIDTGDNQTSISATGWSELPYVAGGFDQQSMYFADRQNNWRAVADGLEPSRSYRAIGGVLASAGPEVWTANTRGAVFRLAEGQTTWRPVELALPPSYECGSPYTCGWRLYESKASRLSSIVRDDRAWVYITGLECYSVVEMRADGACASYLEVPDPIDAAHPLRSPVTTHPDGSTQLHALRGGRIYDGWLMLVGDSGGVYELWVGEGDPPE